jgi:sarcosine oxidase subunit gamma
MGNHAVKTTAPAAVDMSWLETPASTARLSFRGNSAAIAAASTAFGVPLPTEACRAATVGTRSALWLGPDEYLLIAPESERLAIIQGVARDLAAHPHSLVDVSHRQNALIVKGPHAVWLLESGCPLDLDLSRFPVGMCTRTLFEKSEIMLWRTGTDTFHLEVWRSFMEYVIALLTETAHELPA